MHTWTGQLNQAAVTINTIS